jgi:GrpB-like predicted nucleotidyltransferase (UPF0157 family)
MPAERTPATPRPSVSRSLKTKHRKAGRTTSLKAFLRDASDAETQQQAKDWLHNKTANTSKPPHRIGRTRQRVKSGGNKGQVKKLDGK